MKALDSIRFSSLTNDSVIHVVKRHRVERMTILGGQICHVTAVLRCITDAPAVTTVKT